MKEVIENTEEDESGQTIYYYEEVGYFPPWIEEVTEEYEDEYGKYVDKYYENTTIKEVKIIDGIKPLYTSCWFYYCINLAQIENSQYINTSDTTDMQYMFYSCENLTSIDVSKWDISNVTDMAWMFHECTNLTSIDVSNWNTSNVTNMSGVFCECINLTSIDVSNWTTSNVRKMQEMFSECTCLTSLELTNWNLSKVTNMSYMFKNCSSLTKITVGSEWEIPSTANTTGMFDGCGTSQVE